MISPISSGIIALIICPKVEEIGAIRIIAFDVGEIKKDLIICRAIIPDLLVSQVGV